MDPDGPGYKPISPDDYHLREYDPNVHWFMAGDLAGRLLRLADTFDGTMREWLDSYIDENRYAHIGAQVRRIRRRRDYRFHDEIHRFRQQLHSEPMQVPDTEAMWHLDRQDHHAMADLLFAANPELSVRKLMSEYDTLFGPLRANLEQLIRDLTRQITLDAATDLR